MTKFNEWIRDDSGLALAIVVTVAARENDVDAVIRQDKSAGAGLR